MMLGVPEGTRPTSSRRKALCSIEAHGLEDHVHGLSGYRSDANGVARAYGRWCVATAAGSDPCGVS